MALEVRGVKCVSYISVSSEGCSSLGEVCLLVQCEQFEVVVCGVKRVC